MNVICRIPRVIYVSLRVIFEWLRGGKVDAKPLKYKGLAVSYVVEQGGFEPPSVIPTSSVLHV